MAKTNKRNRNKKTTESRLARIERYVGQHHGEVKANYIGTGYVPNTSGGTFMVSSIAQGDTIQERTGNCINLHSILRNVVYTMTTSCTVRILLYRDRFNEGAFPAVNDVLENQDVTSPYNFQNVVQRKRFIILHDESQNFTTGGKLTHTSMKSIPHECKVYYSGATSAISNMRANNIFMIVITDQATPGSINYTTQVQFTDE
jgi:hypothetical protein